MFATVAQACGRLTPHSTTYCARQRWIAADDRLAPAGDQTPARADDRPSAHGPVDHPVNLAGVIELSRAGARPRIRPAARGCVAGAGEGEQRADAARGSRSRGGGRSRELVAFVPFCLFATAADAWAEQCVAPARSRRWRGMGLRRTGRRVADRLAAAAARRRRGSACLQSLVSRRLGCTRLGSRLADLCRTRALPAGRGRAMTCGGAMAASRMPARSPVRPRRHRCRMRSKTAERTGGRPNRGRRRLRFGTRRGRRRPLKPRRHQAEERERHGSDDRQLPDAHLSRTREPVTRRDSLAWRTALPALLRLPVEARVVARGLTDRRPFEWVLDRPTALVPKIIGTRRPLHDPRVPARGVTRPRRGVQTERDELLLRADPIARERNDVAVARVVGLDLPGAMAVRFQCFAGPYKTATRWRPPGAVAYHS